MSLDDDDDSYSTPDPEASEKLWDELAKQNRRQQERLQRAIEELLGRGLDHDTALREALREIVPDRLEEETDSSDEPWRGDEHATFGESLEDEALGEGDGYSESDDERFDAEEKERHPLLQRAMDLVVRFGTVFGDDDNVRAPALSTLYQGGCDAMGGLAQALSLRDHGIENFGLCVVQLKRALRGAAFARGALFPLRSTISAEQFDELFQTLRQMETDIVTELGKVRAERDGDL